MDRSLAVTTARAESDASLSPPPGGHKFNPAYPLQKTRDRIVEPALRAILDVEAGGDDEARIRLHAAKLVHQAHARLLGTAAPPYRIYSVLDAEAGISRLRSRPPGTPDSSNAESARPFDTLRVGHRIRKDLSFSLRTLASRM